MLPTLKKFPASASYPENIPILLVSPHTADFAALRQILHHSDWNITHVAGIGDATQYLKAHAASIVVCERDLPDGSWKDLLKCSADLDNTPMLLVVSRHADDALWAEVLNLGGYDVLLKPFDKAEVARVVGMAWRHWWGLCTGLATRTASAQMLHTA
jgi:DNA-binding response OmpR family regulator